MNPPSEDSTWVIRTDFSSDDRWTAVRDLIAAPWEIAGTTVYGDLRFVNDGNYSGRTTLDLVRTLPDNYPGMLLFIVDRECVENPEHPVLVVGFYPSDGESFDRMPQDTPEGDVATFRSLPSQVHGIQINLSLGNMDFEEFAGAADSDGVFRGFPY